MKKANQMNLAERLVAPKPRFFRIMRNVGLMLAAASGAVLAAPVALPATLVINTKTGKRKLVQQELHEGELEKLIDEVKN